MHAAAPRILIVEDDQGLAELFGDLLEQAGARCARIGSGRECRAWLASNEADLLLIDYSLPDCLARVLVDELRDSGALRPFIIVTGHGDERVAVDMMKLGARDYLVKDNLVLDRLPAVVRRTLQEIEKEQRLAASEHALRESEVRLAEAMDLAHLAHWEFDVATSTFTFNDRFYALYGTTAAREGGYRMPAETYAREFLLPEDAHMVADEIRRAVEAVSPEALWRTEHRMRRRDGALRHVSVQIVVLKDAAGRTIGTRGVNQDITERKEAEERLRASDAFRERVFDSSPIPIVVLDPETGRFLDCNAAAVSIYQAPSRSEVVGKGPLDFSAPVQYDGTPSAEKASAHIAQALTGETLQFEWLHRRPDATRWDGEVRLMSFIAEGRRLIQFTLHDITELKRTQTALEHSEALFRRTFDEAPVGAAIVTPAGTFQRVNAALCRFLGYTEEALVSRRFVDVTHPEDLDESRTLVRRLLQGEIDAFDQEKRYLRKDGTIVWGRASVSLVRDAAGQPLHLVPIIQDITARKQAEEDLRHSEQRYATTLAAVNDGLWEWNVSTGTAYFSPSYYAVLGYADGAFVANYANWRELVHPEEIGRVEANLRQSVETGLGFNFDLRMKTADGEWRWVCTRGNTIERDPQGRAQRMVGTLSDASRRKQAEAELQRTRAILQVAMDQSPAGIAIADAPGGELRYVNDAGLAIGGGDRATIVDGVGIERYVASWKLFDLDGKPLATDQIPMVRALTRGETARSEFIIRRADNDDRIVVSHAAPIRDETGRIIAGVVVFLDITDLKHAERNLEQFFTLVPDMVCIASTDGRFLVLNDAWERVLGYTKTELMAAPYATFIHPDDLAATSLASTSQQGGRPVANFVNRYRAKDGSYRWLEWNATAAGDDGLVFAAARDITEHRLAEAAIRESEVRFRTLADSGQALIWTSGLDKKCNYFNQPWLDFTGRTLAQELGDGWTEGVHPDDFDRCVATYARAFDRRERFSMDYRIRHHSGEYRWIQDTGSPRFDSHGEFLGYIGHCLDITERKKAEQALRESEARYRNTIEFAVDGILQGSAGGVITGANTQMLELSGWPLHRLVGQTIAVLFEPAELAAKPLRFDLLQSGQTVVTERMLRRADGQPLPVEMVSKQMPDGTYQSIVRDITERKQAEQALRESEEKFARAFRSAPVMTAITDLETGAYLDMNEEVLRVSGFTRAEMLGHSAVELGWLSAEQRTRLADEIRAHGKVQTLEVVLRTKAGEPRHAWVSGEKITIGGRPCLLTVTVDVTDSKRAEEERRQSHELLTKLAAQVPGIVYQYQLFPDGRTCFPYSSPGIRNIYELEPEEVRTDASPVLGRLHPEDAEFVMTAIRESARTLAPFHCEFRVVLPRQGLRWRLSDALPERLPDGGTLWYGIISDITERRVAEESLHASLREKEALLKEVHHRVKNNLQIISSLLRLQAGQIDEPTTVGVLQDMQGRIRSMALLHETLYRSGNLAQVDLAAYLEAVCTQLLRAHQRTAGMIDLHLEIAPVALDATQAVPCGLLVNELVSNALKHAFPAQRGGEIRVALNLATPSAGEAAGPASLHLSVTDDGVGLPAQLDVKNLRSLGLQLGTDLARQLQGTLEIGASPTGGAAFALTFTPPPGSVSLRPNP